MVSLVHLKKLDKVLDYLKENEQRETADPVTFAELSNYLARELNYEITTKELLRIYTKLKRDEYVFETGGDYYLTYDGYVFHGYERQKEIEDLAYTISVQSENQIKSAQRKLLWGTWFAGIAALLLLLWQVFLYFYPVHADYPYFFWQK